MNVVLLVSRVAWRFERRNALWIAPRQVQPDTHHAPLTYDEAGQTLTCTECRRVFEIRDGLPVLLLDEARPPTPTEGG